MVGLHFRGAPLPHRVFHDCGAGLYSDLDAINLLFRRIRSQSEAVVRLARNCLRHTRHSDWLRAAARKSALLACDDYVWHDVQPSGNQYFPHWRKPIFPQPFPIRYGAQIAHCRCGHADRSRPRCGSAEPIVAQISVRRVHKPRRHRQPKGYRRY